MNPRRRARERALELLYESETKDVVPSAIISTLPVPPEPYAITVADGVATHQDDIDGVIARYAKDWKLARMPAIDRAVLRLAVFELTHQPDVPTAVVISEAVALAKQYSTEDSGRFVNGVLSRVATELRPS